MALRQMAPPVPWSMGRLEWSLPFCPTALPCQLPAAAAGTGTALYTARVCK